MATINVPADHPNIQTALDNASNDDTIIVADGEYSGADNCTLDFNDLRITLESANGPKKILVDCSTESFVRFPGTQASSCVVDGFTVHSRYGSGWIARCDATTGLTVQNCYARMCTTGGRGAFYITTGSCNTINNLITDGCTVGNNNGLLGQINGAGTLTSKHDTVIGCGPGDGIELLDAGATFVATNTVIWVPDYDPIINSVGATETITYCNFSGGAHAGTGNISSQPWTYLELHEDDPGIDAGTDASVTTDIYGTTRPSGDDYDMGALEYI
tara:strand:+ start:6544 stop:7362 length:819 start_codon:yes stop_codon:yes gene_type:complete